MHAIFILAIVALMPFLHASDHPSEKESKIEDMAKISEAYGHLIGRNLQNAGFQLDLSSLVKGLTDSAAGLESPMSEQECVHALTLIQEKWFKQQSEHNLKEAVAFLEHNAKRDGIYLLNDGKIQYRIDAEGSGEVLEDHASPLVRVSGKFLDGSSFADGSNEEKIHLDEILPGLKDGLLGMKEGEKRTIFIHPDLGYGMAHFLPPNSLLTFEVELIKANAPIQEPPAAPHPESEDAEIAGEIIAR